MSGSWSWIVPVPFPVFRFSSGEKLSSITPELSLKAKARPVHEAVGLAVLSVGTLGKYKLQQVLPSYGGAQLHPV